MDPPPETAVLIGAESTGKTTLAAQLAEHYGTIWCPEYAREFAERKGDALDFGDVEAIAKGQLALEEEYLERAGRLLVFDTNILSTIVYSNHYYAASPDWVEAALRARAYGLYLLMDVDVPWEPDSVRDATDIRGQIHERFRKALRVYGCRHIEIQGDWSGRFDKAVLEIDALLTRS
ncbi:MAG: ATP-binding protein [Candidatus Hydrogenedentes bacterium]|nr:ATP-binding protein [Candidatus Hydrogenedentota bacterium]